MDKIQHTLRKLQEITRDPKIQSQLDSLIADFCSNNAPNDILLLLLMNQVNKFQQELERNLIEIARLKAVISNQSSDVELQKQNSDLKNLCENLMLEQQCAKDQKDAQIMLLEQQIAELLPPVYNYTTQPSRPITTPTPTTTQTPVNPPKPIPSALTAPTSKSQPATPKKTHTKLCPRPKSKANFYV